MLCKEKQMGLSLIWTNLLTEPLFTLYTFLPFILYKDLGASAFQVTLLMMLKPFITILSFYWSAGLHGSTHKLKSNVLWAGLLMRAPFLLCPWIHSAWYLIFAATNYMFFYRAGIPAWLEILKRNMSSGKRGRSFSISSALGYAEGVILALACGSFLDKDPSCWKILFFGTSAIVLITLLVQARIVLDSSPCSSKSQLAVRGIKEILIRPWRDSYRLMRERLDFSRFQWGFMVSGFGLMLIQPAIPLFAVDVLGISYLEMAAAICIAKGLGFIVSTPIWTQWINQLNTFKVASLVFLAVGLFTVLLSLSIWSIAWLYIAYFWYGVGQGGSHLVWNLSGPIFSGKEESSKYTGVGLVLAGIRGAIAPPLGGWLSVLFGPVAVLVLGGALCFYSGIRLLQSRFAKGSLPIKT